MPDLFHAKDAATFGDDIERRPSLGFVDEKHNAGITQCFIERCIVERGDVVATNDLCAMLADKIHRGDASSSLASSAFALPGLMSASASSPSRDAPGARSPIRSASSL